MPVVVLYTGEDNFSRRDTCISKPLTPCAGRRFKVPAMAEAATAKTREVHFSISGEFITEMARDFVREGSWRKGYDFLMDNLGGIDASTVLDILKGVTRLDGVNEVEPVPDTSEAQAEIQESLEFQFRDTFAFEGALWRPYGYVDTFCRDDMVLAGKVERSENPDFLRNRFWLKAQNRLWAADEERPTRFETKRAANRYDYRSLFYMHDIASDITVKARLALDGLTRPVHCKRIEVEPPIWFKLPKDPHPVIAAAEKAGRLADLYDDCFPPELREPSEEGDEDDAPVELDDEAKASLQAQREDRERAERVRETMAKLFERELEEAIVNIKAFADTDVEYGWREFTEYDEKAGRNVSIRVPYRAFVCTALRRAAAHDLMPAYAPFVPSGAKMANDCRYHSDAWFGCGGVGDNAYDNEVPEQRLFMSKLFELQHELLTLDFDLLARSSADFVAGDVTHDPDATDKTKVLVLKSASPEFAEAALRSQAVIVETGSKLAHLVVVSREVQVPVIRVDDAQRRFPPGCRVGIDFKNGTLERSEGFGE